MRNAVASGLVAIFIAAVAAQVNELAGREPGGGGIGAAAGSPCRTAPVLRIAADVRLRQAPAQPVSAL